MKGGVSPKLCSILLALMLSSFGKLVHILMLIWNFNEMEYSWIVNGSVITSNAEALRGRPRPSCGVLRAVALFRTSYWKAYGILAVSVGVKLLFQLGLSYYDAKFPIIFL